MVLPAEPRFAVLPVEPPRAVLMAELRLVVLMAEPRFVVLLVEPRFAVPPGRRLCALLMAEQSMWAVSGRGSALPITALS
jgi:hypothetical protein